MPVSWTFSNHFLYWVEDEVWWLIFITKICTPIVLPAFGGNYAAKKGPIFNGQYVMGNGGGGDCKNTHLASHTYVVWALELVIELEGFETLRAIALLEHYGFKAALRVFYNFLNEIIRKVCSNNIKLSYFYLQFFIFLMTLLSCMNLQSVLNIKQYTFLAI